MESSTILKVILVQIKVPRVQERTRKGSKGFLHKDESFPQLRKVKEEKGLCFHLGGEKFEPGNNTKISLFFKYILRKQNISLLSANIY